MYVAKTGFSDRVMEHSSSGTTVFEPQGGIEKKESSSTANSVSPTAATSPLRAPEKKLTLFALRLAVIEKIATGLGTLGFIWATVVLLGGFAITLSKTDFWFITIILLIEGARIFSRSHELEWQHQSTWSLAEFSSQFVVGTIRTVVASLFDGQRKTNHGGGVRNLNRSPENPRKPGRTWPSSDVPLLPGAQWVSLSRNVSRLLYWLQLASAIACVVLSLLKLVRHDYGSVTKGEEDKRNRETALVIFYSLALAEASLFLMEKAYWEWKVTCRKLLDEVNKECEFGPSGLISIRRFFYDSYSRCVNGSIFDGLKMDMVSFGIDLLESHSPDEQLIGARILRRFCSTDRFSDDTLEKIGTNISIIERLLEILNWKHAQDEEIRLSSAEILSKLAGKKQNSLRVAEIPGAMESISSLLQTGRFARSMAMQEPRKTKTVLQEHVDYGFWTFNHMGLLILKKLARDPDNCGKIGNTRGLLPKIIDFTHAGDWLLNDEYITPSQILTIKRSLQLVKMLSNTPGTTGKLLRAEISEMVFTISNIRDILKGGVKYPLLQKLGTEILTSLALEEEGREKIGRTGGVLKELFTIFFDHRLSEFQDHVRTSAGEALAMLALESRSNCGRILKLHPLNKLLSALETPLICINAARILRNLCCYSGPECLPQLHTITSSAPTVIKAIMLGDDKLQEVMIGLAAEAFKLLDAKNSSTIYEQSQVKEAELANTIVRILRRYSDPPLKVPRIRRFAIELATWMMMNNAYVILLFRRLGLEKELRNVLESTSEIESFNTFSGAVGLSRHNVTIHSLVDAALDLLKENTPPI